MFVLTPTWVGFFTVLAITIWVSGVSIFATWIAILLWRGPGRQPTQRKKTPRDKPTPKYGVIYVPPGTKVIHRPDPASTMETHQIP